MMDINSLLQEIVDGRFRDFAGLRLSATVPVRDALINELIAQVLASAAAPASPAAAGGSVASAPAASTPGAPPPLPGLPGGLRIAPSDIAPLVRKVAVRAEQGRIVLDLEIAID